MEADTTQAKRPRVDASIRGATDGPKSGKTLNFGTVMGNGAHYTNIISYDSVNYTFLLLSDSTCEIVHQHLQLLWNLDG